MYYVFYEENKAINAEKDLCKLFGYPKKGKNAKTKEGATEDKQKTVKWANVIPTLAGDYVFQAVPAEIFAECPQKDVDKFFEQHNPTIEEYNPEWFE